LENQGLRTIMPKLWDGCETKFLYYSLIPYTLRLRRNSRGSAQGVIGKAELNAISLWVPSISIQKRIVAKVDELMALCDRLEEQQQERQTRHAHLARASLARFADAPTPANLHFLFHKSYAIPPADLRKSILTLAVQGKLVPQDPNDEPAKKLLDRIFSDYPPKNGATDKSFTENLEDLPFGIPLEWSAARLGSILDPNRGISYGVIKLGAEPQKDGVFILRCSNVRYRRIDLNGIRKVTEQLSSEYSRTILEGGEVLINVRGTLGGCAVVPPSLKGYNIAREVAVIPVHSEIDPAFLMNVIASPYFQNTVDENLRGIAYSGLNLGLLRDFMIPIPPLAEQRGIVAKVDQLMALVDELETQLAASRSTAKNLLDALVAELASTP
jgi:type I restriction enzyme S subunit